MRILFAPRSREHRVYESSRKESMLAELQPRQHALFSTVLLFLLNRFNPNLREFRQELAHFLFALGSTHFKIDFEQR